VGGTNNVRAIDEERVHDVFVLLLVEKIIFICLCGAKYCSCDGRKTDYVVVRVSLCFFSFQSIRPMELFQFYILHDEDVWDCRDRSKKLEKNIEFKVKKTYFTV
jgi:hypothetical protein